MRIAAGVVYWFVWQSVAGFFMVVGWLVLLPLAAGQLWELRPGRSWMFPGRAVLGWKPSGLILTVFALFIVPVALWGRWAALSGLAALWGATAGVWDNEEDGVLGGPGWRAAHPGWPDWALAYGWSAWRNSANGLRWLPGAAFVIGEGLRVRDYSWGYVATYGWRWCVYWRKGWMVGWLINRDARAGWRSWPVLEPKSPAEAGIGGG